MRKITLFLLILISSYTLFAADPALGIWTWNSGGVSGSAYVPVSVSSKVTKKCVVGFATSIPVDFGVATSTVTPMTGNVSLSISDADGTASNSSAPLYLYYQIASGENINIAIYGEKELSSTSENSANQDTVKWAVKNTNTNTTYVDFGIEETKGNSENGKVTVYQHRPQETTTTSESGVETGNKFGNAGSIKLTINTESLWAKKADGYSANLIVVVSTDSSASGGN